MPAGTKQAREWQRFRKVLEFLHGRAEPNDPIFRVDRLDEPDRDHRAANSTARTLRPHDQIIRTR